MYNRNKMIFKLMSENTTIPDAEQAKSNESLIAYLQKRACSVLDELIPPYANAVLLDYPNNPNVGDSLIWLGEIAYLKSRHINIKYVCDIRNYERSALENALDEATVILMHGGGNFGTVWPEMQSFRERILTDFPNVPCVQLPQSISFDNREAIERSAAVINAHRNFTILTRDKDSYDFACREFLSNVKMCPDMAFFIGAVKVSAEPKVDCLVLSRSDHEKANNWIGNLSFDAHDLDVKVVDWLKPSRMGRLIHRIEMHTVSLRRLVDKQNKMLLPLWSYLSKVRMRRGIRILQQGRVVYTDRLHAHILSILINKPHVLVDNANKKISGFYKTWTIGYPRAHFVESRDEASAALKVIKKPARNYSMFEHTKTFNKRHDIVSDSAGIGR